MDIYSLLIEDHRKIKRWLNALKRMPSDKKTLETLFQELSAHDHCEEKVVYPAIKKKLKKDFNLLIEGSEKEHHMTEELIKTLRSLSSNHPERLLVVAYLQKGLLAHIDKEENQIFALANKYITAAESKLLGEKFAKEKAIELEKNQDPIPDRVASTLRTTVRKVASKAGLTAKRGRPKGSDHQKDI